MTKTDMAKLPGLFQRGSVYQLRVVVPLDLRAAYGGKSKLVQSLDTLKRPEAVLRATHERARLLEEFEHQRRILQPQRLDSVTPEMASELAQRVRATVLRVDDTIRDNPGARAALFGVLDGTTSDPFSVLTIGGPRKAPVAAPSGPHDALAGMSDGETVALSALNDIMNKAAGVRLTQRNLQAILPLVKEEAHKLGLTFDPQAPGAREALQAALKAYRQAWQEVTQRDAGEIVDTPAVQSIKKPPAQLVKLRDVYTRWQNSKPRKEDSVKACLRAVSLYEEFTGNPPIDQLTREQGDGFRAWLQHADRKTTSKTARDRLTWVKSVLKYAARDLGLIDRNPWEGIDIAFKTTHKRRPWTSGEIHRFFSQPLYTSYELPSDKKAGGDAAYWIPLLGLYTGARVGELAQLRVSDLETAGEIPVVSIAEEDEGQSVKTTAGVRKVPLHSELIRLGFLDYVETMRRKKQALLWPVLATREGKPGGYFSHWFGVFRRSPAVGFGRLPDFHCLRHTVRSQLAEAEISEPVMDALVGHEIQGSTGAKVYTHRSLTTLKRAVEVLKYPALSLQRVYKAPKPQVR